MLARHKWWRFRCLDITLESFFTLRLRRIACIAMILESVLTHVDFIDKSVALSSQGLPLR